MSDIAKRKVGPHPHLSIDLSTATKSARRAGDPKCMDGIDEIGNGDERRGHRLTVAEWICTNRRMLCDRNVAVLSKAIRHIVVLPGKIVTR